MACILSYKEWLSTNDLGSSPPDILYLFCDPEYLRTRALKDHVTHHSNPNLSLEVVFCDPEYLRTRALKDHVTSGGKVFCDPEYLRTRALKDHVTHHIWRKSPRISSYSSPKRSCYTSHLEEKSPNIFVLEPHGRTEKT